MAEDGGENGVQREKFWWKMSGVQLSKNKMNLKFDK